MRQIAKVEHYKTMYNHAYNEYVVKPLSKYDEHNIYYAMDKQDALDTMETMNKAKLQSIGGGGCGNYFNPLGRF